MIIQKDKNILILRLKRGEHVIKELTGFTLKNKIKSTFFYGIGALDETELAHYNVGKKKYTPVKFKEELELVSLIGNICRHEEKPLIHAHACLSDKEMKTIGGHFVEGKVSGTCEIILTLLNKKIEKFFDPETGLKLMKPTSNK